MHLSRNRNGVIAMVADGTPFLVFIIEHERYTSFRDAGLPLLIDELLQIADSNLGWEEPSTFVDLKK